MKESYNCIEFISVLDVSANGTKCQQEDNMNQRFFRFFCILIFDTIY